MWTDPGWFIYQLDIQIWFWSSAAWPPTFLFSSFATLYSSSLWRTDTIVFSKLNKSPSQICPPSNGLEINKLPREVNRGFTVDQESSQWKLLTHSNCAIVFQNPNRPRSWDCCSLFSEVRWFGIISDIKSLQKWQSCKFFLLVRVYKFLKVTFLNWVCKNSHVSLPLTARDVSPGGQGPLCLSDRNSILIT